MGSRPAHLGLAPPRRHCAEPPREGAELKSGVPLATFGACDPAVEAQLLDDVVTRVFLRHLNKDAEARTAEPMATPGDAPQRRDRPVTHADLRRFGQQINAIERATAPALDERLATERLWILIDVTQNGGGVARQRATHELRAAMRDLQGWAQSDREVLRALADLQPTSLDVGDPLLLRALRHAAQRALASNDARGTP